jgi:imidazolonepropionase-like amidohydrolase
MKPILVALCTTTLAAGTGAAQERLAITSASVIDGRTGRVTNGLTILVEGDRIVAVGPPNRVRIPEGTTLVDATGKWVTPGFIDVHTHSAPPAVLRRALALGVTAIHMMPSRPVPRDSLRDLEMTSNAAESLTPRLRITSPLFTGTFPANVLLRATNFVKPQSADEVERTLNELQRTGFRGIKIIQDDGKLWSGADNVVPRLSDGVFSALVQNAHRHGMTVYAHVTQLKDTEQAVAAKAGVFVHGTMDSLLADTQWIRMRDQRTVWAPAFRIVAEGADRAAYGRRVLGDTFLRERLTPSEMEAMAGDTARTRQGDETFAALPRSGAGYVRVMAENTRRARQHGVTIAAGSDAGVSGNGPGIGTHIEMELLHEAGLTPAEVIVASTFGGALALKMQDQLGTIEVGKRADFVILNRNPLSDIRNARAVERVIKAGKVVKFP